MNHPFLYPEQACWTPEYKDAHLHKHASNDDDTHSRYWCDESEEEYLDALYGVV